MCEYEASYEISHLLHTLYLFILLINIIVELIKIVYKWFKFYKIITLKLPLLLDEVFANILQIFSIGAPGQYFHH